MKLVDREKISGSSFLLLVLECMYKSSACNILETAFICWDGFSIAILYQPLNGNHTALVTTDSTGVAFTAFTDIVVYRDMQQLFH